MIPLWAVHVISAVSCVIFTAIGMRVLYLVCVRVQDRDMLWKTSESQRRGVRAIRDQSRFAPMSGLKKTANASVVAAAPAQQPHFSVVPSREDVEDKNSEMQSDSYQADEQANLDKNRRALGKDGPFFEYGETSPQDRQNKKQGQSAYSLIGSFQNENEPAGAVNLMEENMTVLDGVHDPPISTPAPQAQHRMLRHAANERGQDVAR